MGILAGLETVARLVVPLAYVPSVVEITKHGAYLWGPPGNAHADLIASLSIRCYRGTETLTVPSAVTGT